MKRWVYGAIVPLAIILIVAAVIVHKHSTRKANEQASRATTQASSDNSTTAGNSTNATTPSTTSLGSNSSTTTNSSSPKVGTKPLSSITSCNQLLTAAQANTAADTTATPSSVNGANDQNANVRTITCDYTGGDHIINVTAHIAKTSAGDTDDTTIFGSGKPSDVTNVSGYGQKAYWQPDSGTLNVLLGNNWYEISEIVSGKTVLATTEQLANVVLGNL